MKAKLNNLERLSKENDKWQRISLKICGNKQTAQDVLQDAYIKMASVEKEMPDYYFAVVIKNTFLNHIKKQNKTKVCELEYIEDNNKHFEPTDKEQQLINRFNKIDWVQQELILESYNLSLRQIEERFPTINYGYAYRQIHEGLKEILGNDYDKHNNSRIKYQK